ncbi:SubName: Full=Uncharacterized protein {ECO:0000313/EMBL:CCA77979.1} [Serendipita indica DSM 11827]|uniref:Guanine nucleotide-binding protein subunit gamma n=1 Tax=Serendipita indica (strain DSM 11827) TaxID=1109443 RepID=G4U313_SERID|nr:SubName: Full=Uncharacterized protein {ECO:0000313/EMBL:CCA77979.1} [Serendipita indica DSM 11827]CCA77979.1 hypothetical protein PIIN_00693 [Serendipita indica DSM 11827]
MAELKLHRINQHIARLRDDVVRPRARVSEASSSLIRYMKTTKDPLLPSLWGTVAKEEDPFHQPDANKGCCIVS